MTAMTTARDGAARGGTGAEGLRERKKAATRQALGAAAMRLAVERGLDNVLVEDIAAEAGVSVRTFSNYFGSKYEACCAIAAERGRQIGAALRARPPGEPLMAAITRAVLDQYGHAGHAPDRDWVAGLRLAFRSPPLQGEQLRAQYAAQQELAAAIADRIGGDPVADMRPAIIAGAVAAAIGVAMDRWLRADPPAALAPLLGGALGQLACLADGAVLRGAAAPCVPAGSAVLTAAVLTAKNVAPPGQVTHPDRAPDPPRQTRPARPCDPSE